MALSILLRLPILTSATSAWHITLGTDEHWGKYCAASSAPGSSSIFLTACSATRTTAYSGWFYAVLTTTQHATPLPSPLSQKTSYAPQFSAASSLLPPNATYTAYSLEYAMVTLSGGQYGQAAIGIPCYSFSISWTRIVPFGDVDSPISTPGLDHYDDVIDTCLEYGITPIVTFGFNPFMEFAKSPSAQLYDLEHSLYYQDFLRETLKAMYEDGVLVIGALAWSFVDNDEFVSYEQQYGLQTVNRTDGVFTRRFQRSFLDLVDFFRVR